MKFGFSRISTNNFEISISDCFKNANSIVKSIKESYNNKVEIAVFPELCITGYTCGDLFLQKTLIEDAKNALKYILYETKDLNITSVIGIPVEVKEKLYNCGVVIYKGSILGIVPKTYLPNYSEFYEKRIFNSAPKETFKIRFLEQEVFFGTKILFSVENKQYLKFSLEICEDLWAVIPPSSFHCLAGATLVVNLSASNEVIGKRQYRRELVLSHSAKSICAYAYCSAGEGESTTDTVFSSHNIIAEDGHLMRESNLFKSNIIYADIDLDYIANERRTNTSFEVNYDNYTEISYEMEENVFELNRTIDKSPFIPKKESESTVEEILNIQAYGIKQRLKSIGIKKVVIGISGGLDSTYALLALNYTYDLLNYDKKNIIAVTLPCFGTSKQTYENAKNLCKLLGVTLMEINIKASVLQHFKDIGHSDKDYSTVYENSQSRERTQILMDIANKNNALFIGTSDLSEIALGFSTYNGDHMSMYAINSSIPKTLIKYLIENISNKFSNDIKEVLKDILNTPISPELLPLDTNENIAQITENILGPYEVHDFFIYNFLRLGYEPEKIFYLAKIAFKNVYSDDELLKWLKQFYIRFFNQQFKRSCMPDGIKIGSVSLSPRTDFKMPSDASFKAFLKRLENI